MLLSIVIPLFNEAKHLESSLEHWHRLFDTLDITVELILVDDGSQDSTWACIRGQATHHTRVLGIRLSRNFGKEAALAAGLEHARGDAVAVMDGDLQHPPELLREMLAHWRAGAEVVEAVKARRGSESKLNRWAASVFYSAFSKLTGQDLNGASDFKLMDKRVLDAWRQMGERNLFFRGMHAWLGFQRVQLPFEVSERADGTGKWSKLALVTLATRAITAFSSAPLQLTSAIGAGFLAFALALGLQTLYVKLSGRALDGFTTVILLLLLIGGAVMIGLGVIGVYIARIYDEVKQRPRFLVAERTENCV
jgi:glycosyltransferase involved in cell wall biosynthesis